MSPSTRAPAVVRIERILRAPPQRVFQAWLDPQWVRQWMTPGEVVAEKVVVEPRVGGRFALWQSLHGEDIGGAEGEFLEIVPGRKLVYRWAFVGPERKLGEFYDTLVTVTFEAAPGATTKVVVVHEQLEGLRQGAPNVAAMVDGAWAACMARLDVLLFEGLRSEAA